MKKSKKKTKKMKMKEFVEMKLLEIEDDKYLTS